MRNIVNVAFAPRNINRMVDQMNGIVEKIIDNVRPWARATSAN